MLASDKELEELLLSDTKTVVYFPVSCQEYADNGATQNGSYRVQPNSNIPRKYILQLLHIRIYNLYTPFKHDIRCASLCGVDFIVTKERRKKRAQRESRLKGVRSL